jgi:hypothetical protein
MLHPAERALFAWETVQRALVIPELLAEQVSRLETLLQSIGRTPAAVTIARSSDGYSRIHDIPSIESAVMAMLERVYGGPLCVTYAKGASSLTMLEHALEGQQAEHDAGLFAGFNTLH